MRIALAQINSHLGNFKKNSETIVENIKRAKEKHCDLVVFPEMSLFGYRPSDLLERKSIVLAQLAEFKKIHKQVPSGIAVILGLVTLNSKKNGRPLFNSAVLLERGRKPRFFNKELLPTYDVFDEYRHIEHGQVKDNLCTIGKKKTLITICEDIWAWDVPGYKNIYPTNPLAKIKKQKIDLIINISASPFSVKKEKLRHHIVKKTVAHFKAPLIYVNMVGAQDELIFDGGSFAMSAKGKLLAQSVRFGEDLNVVDLNKHEGGFRNQILSESESLRQALVTGIRDFSLKTGIPNVHLGLSGGIDSAVVACLAVDALGPAKVKGFALPGPYSAPESLKLAVDLAKNIGVENFAVDINEPYKEVLKQIEKALGPLPFGVTHENLQSRIRGLVLMAYANLQNSLLLTTGNKSEYATGYCTLYGDMCGGLAPIADLTKKQVYDLANLYNAQRELIPRKIIDRPPTAELKPNQRDSDSLPPYPELDKAVQNIVEEKAPAKNETEKWLISALLRSEFKRWQAPPILRVSEHAFGRGRSFPIANKAQF